MAEIERFVGNATRPLALCIHYNGVQTSVIPHLPPEWIAYDFQLTMCCLTAWKNLFQVGCLHGSPTSGRDVQHVMDRVRPGAVVLELCESRHQSLRRDLEKWARVSTYPIAFFEYGLSAKVQGIFENLYSWFTILELNTT